MDTPQSSNPNYVTARIDFPPTRGIIDASHGLQDQSRRLHLLLLQQCAVEWGTCSIEQRLIERQAAHLGEQPGGGFFVFGRNSPDIRMTSKYAQLCTICCRVRESHLPPDRDPRRDAMEAIDR